LAEVDARRAANGLAVLAELLSLTTPRGVCSQVLHRSAVKHATAGGILWKSSSRFTTRALSADGTSGKRLAGKLESFGQHHLMLPQVLLLGSLLNWMALVLLSLSHSLSTVPWFLLLCNFRKGKLSKKLESLAQTYPMVPQVLLLSPPLHWFHLVLLSLS